MNPRQHAVAAVNAWVCDVDRQNGLIEAVENEIGLAIRTERDRCMAWVQEFDTPETRRIGQGVESGEAVPGHQSIER